MLKQLVSMDKLCHIKLGISRICVLKSTNRKEVAEGLSLLLRAETRTASE